MYNHRWSDGQRVKWQAGKAVCVGRNYVAHARELGNEVPSAPVLFIKPSTAVSAFGATLDLPFKDEVCHFETELCILIGATLNAQTDTNVLSAVAGIGLGLDLTLRDLQTELKDKGYPWERAKAFDNSCYLTPFVPIDRDIDWQQIRFSLTLNGTLQQLGLTGNMVFDVASLLENIRQTFTLLPGDVVMTGTPAGVGALRNGDHLVFDSSFGLAVSTRVVTSSATATAQQHQATHDIGGMT